jgi:hypothetical protein
MNEQCAAIDEDRFAVDEPVHDECERGGSDVFGLAGSADWSREPEIIGFHGACLWEKTLLVSLLIPPPPGDPGCSPCLEEMPYSLTVPGALMPCARCWHQLVRCLDTTDDVVYSP